MLLPISFTLQPESALILLAGIYYGAQYGGSTTAILVNIPGEASSVVTTIDGHQMARQGRAGPALGIAALGSFFAGCVATLLIALAAPPLAADRPAIRPGGIFLADGVRLDRGGRSGARIARQGDRDGRARTAPRSRRHRREFGRPAVQFRHDWACRRHRVRGDCRWRSTASPRSSTTSKRSRRPASFRRAVGRVWPSLADLQALRRLDPARHRARRDSRRTAGGRRAAGVVRGLYAGEERRRGRRANSAMATSGASRRRNPPTMRARRRRSFRC